MKTKVLKFAVVLFILTPLLSMGQSSVEKLYERFAGEKGFTSVHISKQMFSLFSNMNDFEGEDSENFNKTISNLDGLMILSYEPEGEPTIDFINEVEKVIPMSEFKDLMVVNEKDSKVRFLTREKDGEIVEMLMIAYDGDEFTVMSISGIIDLETISKISKGMKIQGMDDLDKLDEKEKK